MTRSRWPIARLALLLSFTAAPVVGDIGGCGQAPEDLDPFKFFYLKGQIDCERCSECGLLTDACARACAGALDASGFPPGCYPLAHDGEVCLNALDAASCADYEAYVTDVAPSTPTECNFCPPDQEPGSAEEAP